MKYFKLMLPALACIFVSCTKNETAYDASGMFESREVIVSAEYAGKILQLNTEEGNIVSKDEICGYIESPTQTGLKNCEIKSTAEGTVILRYAEAGEIATVGKPLFKVADLDNMILRIYISSAQLTKIKLGQAIRVFADFGTERREYSGKVSWISPQAEFTPKNIQVKEDRDNLVYAVKADVRNDGFLKIGMYAEVIL
ncbi:MAG: HlyD family efflux transporter periplasmic adaptor subunit [Bacteroidales bacterium]|jgi:HlyD family secretion protein|nr:HlyD family efflux transporter periplasmic adaptor subunit [Bacteroidales bacterium]